VPYIIAFNWTAVLQFAVFLPIALLQYVGLLPGAVAAPLTLVAFGAVLVYQWFVARVALGGSAAVAAAVVALDVGVAILIEGLAARLG